MVTRKRKIETEQDRYGGYGNGTPIEKSAFRTQDTIQVPDSARGLNRVSNREHDTLYSGRTIERPYPQSEPNRITKSTPLSEEDLMPSIKTMSYIEQKKKADSRESLEGRTKLMLTVYMIIVVLLAAIVIGTGIVINNVTASITNLDAQIEKTQEKITEQHQTIASLDDPFAIAGKAKDPNGLNMEEIATNGYTEIDLIPFKEPISQEDDSNWFDKFCDWMQNMLG